MAIEHPNYWATSLILNFEDASSTTFTDISPTPKTPTVYGTAANSATQFRTGAKSLFLDGNSDNLDYAEHVNFDFGTGAFTIRLKWRPSAVDVNQALVFYGDTTSPTDAQIGFFIFLNGTSGKLIGRVGIGGLLKEVVSTTSPAINTWYDVEFSRDSSDVCRLFINGISEGTPASYPGAIQTATGRILRIGKYDDPTYPFWLNGYIDGLAITKGYAEHTTNFTVSDELYEASPPGTGDAEFTIPAFTAVAYGGASAAASIPMFTASALGGASASFDIPMFGIRATGHDATGERSAAFDMPMFEIEANGGALARFTLPMFGINATLTVPVSMSARVALPMFEIESSGTVGVAGNATLTLTMFGIESHGGGQASVDLPMFAIDASATTGSVGSARFVLPMFDIESGGTVGIVIRASFTIPMFESVQPSSAHVNLPMFGIVAIGHATVTVVYEGYAVNLKPSNKAGVHEVTRWTGMPFDGIVRHGNNYYGWGAQGLHLIGGATDGGNDIAWSWHTAITDFGTSQRKPIRELLFRGRVGPTAAASVSVGERADVTYNYSTPRGQLAQNYRVKTGKGLKDAYYSFGLSGTDVGDVDSVEFGTGISTRRI